jgi:hypothetical protein
MGGTLRSESTDLRDPDLDARLHVGWVALGAVISAIWAGRTMAATGRALMLSLAIIATAAMAGAVVVTANHFVLDAVRGVAVTRRAAWSPTGSTADPSRPSRTGLRLVDRLGFVAGRRFGDRPRAA